MIVLKWICFILVCLDTIGYVIDQADRIRGEGKTSIKVSKFIGFLLGIAARIFVLYGAASCWLLV